MKTPKGKKGKVLKIMREKGFIDNFDCVNGTHGFISLRLGAIIHDLKDEGYIELDEKSGYIGDTKNWRYVLKTKPREIKEYRVNGELVATRVVW